MNLEENKELLISIFTAIEQRNDQRFAELLHPDFEIHWPPSLPTAREKEGRGVTYGTRYSRLRRSEEWIHMSSVWTSTK
jgi:hypothetical protein